MEKRIAWAQGDLTGDGSKETVCLLGEREPGEIVWRRVRLSVTDGTDGRETRIALPQDTGYSPGLLLGNLTSRSRLDILVSMDAGGSGGIGLYAVYRWAGGKYALAFDSQAYNAALSYTVRYADGCAVQAACVQNGLVYDIDLSGRCEAYLSELYDGQGRLREAREGWVDPLSLLYPADVDRDGLLELIAWQRISGLYHADALGDFINTLSWNGRQFALTGQTVGIYGTKGE